MVLTTVPLDVSMTETLFDPVLEMYASTSIWPWQGRAGQKQATIPTANSNGTLFDPWQPRLSPLADLEIIEEKTDGLRPFMGLISYSKVSIGMKWDCGRIPVLLRIVPNRESEKIATSQDSFIEIIEVPREP